MYINKPDTPFLPPDSDHETESERNIAQAESDLPFGGKGFSLSDELPILEGICEPAYLKPPLAEEQFQPASNRAIVSESDRDSVLCTGFTVENGSIIHVPSGTYIHNRKIDVLSLSIRAYNALRRSRIETIVQLAQLTLTQLQNIKNLGKNSVEEVLNRLDHFLSQHIRKEACDPSESAETAALLLENSSIDETTLSVRARNCLHRNGVHVLSELLNTSAEELSEFSNLGAKTLREILCFKDEISDKLLVLQSPAESSFSTEILGYLDEFLKEIKILVIHSKNLKKWLLAELSESYNDMETCYFRWWQEMHVQEALHAYIIGCVKENHMFGISAFEILEKLPPSMSREMMSGILCDLVKNNQIVLHDALYYPVTVSAIEAFGNKSGERYVTILEKRMNQCTLEEIAETYDLTRERVRQLQGEALRVLQHNCRTKKILLTEERFRTLYEAYQFTMEEFTALTGVDERTYTFLHLVTKCGEVSPEKIIYDETLPRWMRNNWICYVRNSPSAKYIYVAEENSRRIAKTRMDIEDYILSKYCQDEVSFEEFVELYNHFIRKYQLEELRLTETKLRTRENKLSQSEFVLWKHGKRLRYYNIPARDYTELLQTLCLSQYHNTEISTLKLFRDNPELMQQYDLRDEYELHNLLKKIGAESENPSMRFERTPGIRFGEYDRDQMIKEKLFELAPIRAEDFANILSEEFGFSFAQTTAWLRCINEYGESGTFTVDSVPMSNEHMALLRSHLTDDCYFYSEVKAIYQHLVPDADTSLISSFNLKRMGFVVNSTYIIQHHDSAAKLFEYLLTQKDVQDIQPLSKRYGCLVSYSQKLAELKDDYDIIEFSPYQYIHIRKLEKMGITKQNLREYCDAVDAFTEPDTYFTVESLQKRGFSHQLDTLGFEAWFYSSLLREDARFSYTKLGGTVLFCKGNQVITEQTFLQSLLQKYSAIKLDVLMQEVYDIYHITLHKDNLRWNIKNTELYYDDIMDKLYKSYDVYFEELQAIDEDDWMESDGI